MKRNGHWHLKTKVKKLELYKAPVPVAEVAVYHLWHVTEMFGKPKKQINLFYFATRIS
jgi:hypothetical protein